MLLKQEVASQLQTDLTSRTCILIYAQLHLFLKAQEVAGDYLDPFWNNQQKHVHTEGKSWAYWRYISSYAASMTLIQVYLVQLKYSQTVSEH